MSVLALDPNTRVAVQDLPSLYDSMAPKWKEEKGLDVEALLTDYYQRREVTMEMTCPIPVVRVGRAEPDEEPFVEKAMTTQMNVVDVQVATAATPHKPRHAKAKQRGSLKRWIKSWALALGIIDE